MADYEPADGLTHRPRGSDSPPSCDYCGILQRSTRPDAPRHQVQATKLPAALSAEASAYLPPGSRLIGVVVPLSYMVEIRFAVQMRRRPTRESLEFAIILLCLGIPLLYSVMQMTLGLVIAIYESFGPK